MGAGGSGVAAPTASHHLCFERKVSNVVSPSSLGSREMLLVPRACHQVSTCCEPLMHPMLSPGQGSVFVVRAFMSLVLAHRTLVLVLRMLVLLASGAALRPPCLVVPCHPRAGLRLCAICVQRCRQDPLLGFVRSSVSMPVWTLSYSLRLP
jgi:hypothetical protein